ncbi:MAG: helix-turn-helix transcriptional regulator [Clostridia bacterium]|nr:helix-turn-helix transcriptional regulator [Clostridia bacterium]
MDKEKVFELYEKNPWHDVTVERKEGYGTSVTGYHKHSYYEINLILSGEVSILLRDRSEEGYGGRIVLTRPETPHYVSCDDSMLYRRVYLLFTDEFIADRIYEWNRLSTVFGASGNVLSLSAEEADRCLAVINEIDRESEPTSKRILIYYLLSRLLPISERESANQKRLPPYIIEALAYVERSYANKFTADDMARELHVGRTTLMTGFKRYTGKTVKEYADGCRLNRAMRLLEDGQTLESAARSCGFSDAGSLIRSFKREFGTTPHKYVNKKI